MSSLRALLRAPSRHFFGSPAGQAPGMESLLTDENASADGDNVSVSKSAITRSSRQPLAPSSENSQCPTSPKPESIESGCVETGSIAPKSGPHSIPARLSTPPKSPGKASKAIKPEGLDVYEEPPSTPTQEISPHASPQKGPTPTWAKKRDAPPTEEPVRESPEHSERRAKSPWGRRGGTARALVLEDSSATAGSDTPRSLTAGVDTPRTPARAKTPGRGYPRLGLGPGHSKHEGHSYMSPTLQALAESLQEEESEGAIEDQSVQVIVRLRPINERETNQGGAKRCIQQAGPRSLLCMTIPEPTQFTFDHVVGDTVSQEALFALVGQPMVQNCIYGYNSSMFAYGQTGSGKTFTMLGDIAGLPLHPSADRGISPRVFEELFVRIKEAEEEKRENQLQYVCKCSFLEIYNEQITDLLEPTSTNLQIREDVKRGVFVEGLSEVAVHGVEDVIRLMVQGANNRKVAQTNMNHESSRSHSVFTCTVEGKYVSDNVVNTRFSRLNLVDLAGSERQKSSGAGGERLKEASNINRSLSALGLVIMTLADVAEGKQRHVPYRDSRLTFLLMDSLGGNAKTIMIANVSPSTACFSETFSTLKFAQRAKFIRNKAVVNEDTSGDVASLKEQIKKLKEELWRIKGPRHSISPPSAKHPGESPGTQMVPGRPSPVTKSKLKKLEAVLAGALRRELAADNKAQRLAADIAVVERLSRQHEHAASCSKMVVKFREDRIKRLEALSRDVLPVDEYYQQEVDARQAEIEHWKERMDRHPEVTRFALDNLRLQDQLRTLQDYCEGGEREHLLEEIATLRDQLIEVLDAKARNDPDIRSSISRASLGGDARAAVMAHQLESVRHELDQCRREAAQKHLDLNAALENNGALGARNEELERELAQLRADALLKPLEAAEGDVARREGAGLSVKELEEELQEANKRIEEETTQRRAVEKDLFNALNDVFDLQTQLEKEKEASQDLEVVRAHVADLEEAVKAAEAAATEARAECEALQQKMAIAEEAHVDALRELAEAADCQEQGWRSKEADWVGDMKSLSGRLLDAQTARETAEEQLEGLTRDLETAVTAAEEHQSNAEKLEARLLARTSDFQRQLSALEERLLARDEEVEILQEDLEREEGLRALEGDAAVDLAVRRVKSAAKAQMRQLARQLEAAMKEAAESQWLKQQLQEGFQDTWQKLQEREAEMDAHRSEAETAAALTIQTLAADADAAFEEGRKIRLEMDRTLKQLQTLACHVAAAEAGRDASAERCRALGVALAVLVQSREVTSSRGHVAARDGENEAWEEALKAALADRDKALGLVEEARRKEAAAVAVARREAEARARALEAANAHVEEMRVALAEAEEMADAAELSKQRVLEEAGRDIEEQKALIAAAESAVRDAQEEREEVEEVLWGSLEAERAKLAHKEAELQSLMRDTNEEVESARSEVAKMREKLGSARSAAERAEEERAELAAAVEKMRGRERALREKEKELAEKERGLTERVKEMAEELREKEEALSAAQRQVEAQKKGVSGPNRAPVLREISNATPNHRYCDAVSETSMFSDAENVPWGGEETRVNDQEGDSLRAVNAELEEVNQEMEQRVSQMEEDLTALRAELAAAHAQIADVRTEKTYAAQDRHIAASLVSEKRHAWLFGQVSESAQKGHVSASESELRRELEQARAELRRLEALRSPGGTDTPPAEFRLHRGRARTSPDGHSVVMTDDETLCQFEGEGFPGFDVAAHEQTMADQLSEVTKQLLQTMAEHAAREAEVQGTLDRLATAEKEKQAGERIMQSLEQRLGDATEELQRLVDAQKHKEAEVRELRARLSNLESEHDAAQAEIQCLEERLLAATEGIASSGDKLGGWPDDEVAADEAKLDCMEEAQEHRDREIAALRARLEAAEKEHERGGLHLEEFLEENVAQPKAQMQQVSTEQHEKAQAVAALQARLNAAQESESALEGRVKELEAAIEEKTREVEQAVQDKGGVAAEELVAMLQERLEEASAQLRATAAALQQKEREQAALADQLVGAERQHKRDHDSLTRVQKAAGKGEEERAALGVQLDEAKRKSESDERRLKELEGELEKLQLEVGEKREEVARLEERLAELEESAAAAEEAASEHVASLEGSLAAAARERSSLLAQLACAQRQVEEKELVEREARQMAESTKEYLEEQEAETEELKAKLAETERHAASLQSQIAHALEQAEQQKSARAEAERALARARAQLASVREVAEGKGSEIATVLRELGEVRAKLSKLESAHDGKERELARAREAGERLKAALEAKERELAGMRARAVGAAREAEHQQIVQGLGASIKRLQGQVAEIASPTRRTPAPAATPGALSHRRSAAPAAESGSPNGSPSREADGIASKLNGSPAIKGAVRSLEEQLRIQRNRVAELEQLADSREKQLFALNARLAAAEGRTHDMVRDMVGLKITHASQTPPRPQTSPNPVVTPTEAASLSSSRQSGRASLAGGIPRVLFGPGSTRNSLPGGPAQALRAKEHELQELRRQMDAFLAEREEWLEEMNRRQAEALAARVATEKLKRSHEAMSGENEQLRERNGGLTKKVTSLEAEVKKLSGQQNLSQRIHHHAKIKEENVLLRQKVEALEARARKDAYHHQRLAEEVARFRSERGLPPDINVDEERRLRKKLEEAQEETLQLAAQLAELCKSVSRAAVGMPVGADVPSAKAAMDAVNRLVARAEASERELADLKLKARITTEKRRIDELRTITTPQRSAVFAPSPDRSPRTLR
ncbi:hypothetical protein KFL_003640070 [Klebsormidium nitens]|uniref:Kinesin motor domain-containing protein n=1 Tax=Klebsormidium nitens TaxID=105231 RepID=A0A1Y1I9F7_KLENI|nr:hypothetical protein KFL_003640070 [Klebsormidium nitens]|eukprot:GAQ87605.1 hypothetical protein KFL_003640070 [Klebsormidium nitens]